MRHGRTVSADRFRRAGTGRAASRVSTIVFDRPTGLCTDDDVGICRIVAASVVDLESTETEAEANGEAKASERGVIVGASASAARRTEAPLALSREPKGKIKGRGDYIGFALPGVTVRL